MDENERRGSGRYGGPEHFAGMNQRGVGRASGDQNVLQEAVAGVEQQSMELLLGEVTYSRPQKSVDVRRTAYSSASLEGCGRDATTELEGGEEASGCRGPYTGKPLENCAIDPGQARYRAPSAGEDGARYVERRTRSTPAADQSRQQLTVRQRHGPVCPHALPGSVTNGPLANRHGANRFGEREATLTTARRA